MISFIRVFSLFKSVSVVKRLDEQSAKCYQHWVSMSMFQKQISNVRVKPCQETHTDVVTDSKFSFLINERG